MTLLRGGIAAVVAALWWRADRRVVLARRRLGTPPPARRRGPLAITGLRWRACERGTDRDGEELLRVLEDAARRLRGGAALGPALELAASQVHVAGAARDLGRVAMRAGAGMGWAGALDEWARAHPVPPVRLAGAAIELAARTGGSPARSLDAVAATLRDRRAFRADLRAMTTQARLSALIIAVAPLAFTAVAGSIDPRALTFLAGPGWPCLAAGLALDGFGWWWMRRLVADAPAALRWTSLGTRRFAHRTGRRASRAGTAGGRGRSGSASPDQVIDELPDLVDLLVLAVSAGLTPLLALRAVAPRAPPSLAPLLSNVLHEVAMGARLADQLEAAARAAGEPARAVLSAVVASERYGTPLLGALERLGPETRTARRVAADQRARRLPVLLLFPLVLCVLPAFVLLTLVPLVAGAVQTLSL